MQELRHNGQRANNAIILIWIVLAVDIISLISSYFQYDLLQTAANGGEISLEYANSNDTRQQIIGITQVIVNIISAVTFIQWFRRAYYNLHLKVDFLAHSESWAAASWFVPVISLFRPYQIMKELFHQTKLLLMKKEIITHEELPTFSLGIWWTLWIINNFIGQYVFKSSMKAETIDELTICTIADMVSSIIGIPLAIITVKIIKEYSQIEPLLLEEDLILKNKLQIE